MTVVAITMVRDEEDIIDWTLQHLLDQGSRWPPSAGPESSTTSSSPTTFPSTKRLGNLQLSPAPAKSQSFKTTNPATIKTRK